MTKLKKKIKYDIIKNNSKCDKTQNLRFDKIQTKLNVTKLKNSKCDKTQNLRFDKVQTKLNKTKLKNSKCDKTQKF